MLSWISENPIYSTAVIVGIIFIALTITAHVKISKAAKNGEPEPTGWKGFRTFSYIVLVVCAIIIIGYSMEKYNIHVPFFYTPIGF